MGTVAALDYPRQISGKTESEEAARAQQVPALALDLTVNNGNSGGPVIDSRGRLLGIIVQADDAATGVAGYTYAIPASTLDPVVRTLKTNGKAEHVSLGLSVRTQNVAHEGLPQAGILVLAVHPEKAGATLGLQVNDVILSVNQRRITTTNRFYSADNELISGEPVIIEVLREKQLVKLEGTLP